MTNTILINRSELNFTNLIKYPLGSVLKIKESKNFLYDEKIVTTFIIDLKHIPDKCICILHSFVNKLSGQEIIFLDCCYDNEEQEVIKNLEIKVQDYTDKNTAFSLYTSYKNNLEMSVKEVTYQTLMKARVNRKFSATLTFIKQSSNPYLINEEVSAIIKYKNEKGVVVLFQYIKNSNNNDDESHYSYWLKWIEYANYFS